MICPHCNTLITPLSISKKLDDDYFAFYERYGIHPTILLCTKEYRIELINELREILAIGSLMQRPTGKETYRTMEIIVTDKVKLYKVGFMQ